MDLFWTLITWLFSVLLNYGSMLSLYKMRSPRTARERKIDLIWVWLGPVGLFAMTGKWLWAVLKWQTPEEVLKEEADQGF